MSVFFGPMSATGRVLLINTHAHDVRLPWAKWHQPTGLLQVGSKLRSIGSDVRLIDCLNWDAKRRMTRRKVDRLQIENYTVDLWRFGGLWSQIDKRIYEYKREKWQPDQIYVSSFQTSWWPAAKELIERIKTKWYPDTPVILGGVYPTVEPEHARKNVDADHVIVGSIEEARDSIPDIELYDSDKRPKFGGVYLYRSQSVQDVENEDSVQPRDPTEIVSELVKKASLGVTEFAFFDEEIRIDHRAHFVELLKEISASEELHRVRFVVVGNMSPQLIDDEVATWIGRASFRQVYLKCDVTLHPNGVNYATDYRGYRDCVEALQRHAGFKRRHGDVTAMLLVGLPNEDIRAVTERLIKLSSIVGSVNLVQYQYSSGTSAGRLLAPLTFRQNGNLDLVLLNSKLYPLARLNGKPYENYADLTRLAALLNSKYRSKTFDFLGNSMIAQAVQESFRTGGWDPFRVSSGN